MITPNLRIETLYILNDEGRIISTREPDPNAGPAFSLIRSTTACAWAVRADVPRSIADELDHLARQETPSMDPRDAPVHADRYVSLVGGRIWSGPAFMFPDPIAQPIDEVVLIDEIQFLERDFQGWTADEIPDRSPLLAVVEDDSAVSVCFCARRSDGAAEAGLETAEAFRGRGFGPRVTAAWALAIRECGLIPLYSTSWSNEASLAVARKLGLVAYGSDWSLSG